MDFNLKFLSKSMGKFGTEVSILQVKFHSRVASVIAIFNVIAILYYVYKSDVCKVLVKRNSKFGDT